MEHMSFELKVISCRDIKAFNFFHKLSVYAAVSIIDDDLKKKNKKEQQQQRSYLQQRHKTPVDRDGGRNPEWNHAVQIDLKEIPFHDSRIVSHVYLRFQIYCEGIGFGNRNIGEVRVPFKDLIDEFDGNIRFVNYQIRTKDGKPNGVLNFSYVVNGMTKKIGTDNRLVPEKVHHPSVGVLNNQKSCLFPEKVHYPSVDVLRKQSSDICYPSLDDIHPTSPSPATAFPNFQSPLQSPSPAFSLKIDPAMASPLFYYCPSPAQEFCSMSTPQSPAPAFLMNHDPNHHPFPSQISFTSGYPPESMVHGYHLHGY
ncbi:hypothetical protein HS088_TW06G00526 [Tripterygium wilfordii]|uniref:C2 domain-containing protein n=1 Tax=Tripterygium wilfordii TaxID=458696 RepID=A0A7J7DJ16_TRIWF|nr:uncharacterized protein LOC120000543 [Tripterygium wilfordii]KAF5746355.1 hypothetical protein HS088_TW06G00526 [Tripterygium wilfordii]